MIARKSVFAIWKRHIPCRIYLCVRDNFSFCEIRIHFKCPLFFRASDETLPRDEMDLFAFVDIIGIRAIGFSCRSHVSLASYYISSRRREAPFPQREINNSGIRFLLPAPSHLSPSLYLCLSISLSVYLFPMFTPMLYVQTCILDFCR